MPLLPGKKNIGHNIKEMEKSGHPHDQSVAAALTKAKVSKNKKKKKKNKSLKESLQTEAKNKTITVGDKKYQKTAAFGNRNVQQIQRNKKKYHRPSERKTTISDSFDALINKYLSDLLFSEDVMNAVKPFNPNAPADPKEQAKIKLAKQKKIQNLQKTQTKPATQAEADAYELGRTEKL